MPRIKLKHIVSVSSEDPAQPAVNLLKPEGQGKWRCANPGEKQVSVIIELEKETHIHAIDIGNNGAALVEVLVGRSSWPADEPYRVLLVTSSFMSPVQSKNFTLTQRVRIFGPEKMTRPIADQKWDRVKVVCTQPFNLNERYGLSFLTLRSPPDAAEQELYADFVPKNLGFFTLKDKQADKIAPGSLLFKQQGRHATSLTSTAANVRDASLSSSTQPSPSATSPTSIPIATRPTYIIPKALSTVARMSNSSAAVGSPRRYQPIAPKPTPPQEQESMLTTKRKHEDLPRKTVIVTPAKKKASHSPPPPKKAKVPGHDKVPLNQLLGGVVFVLSGFKNPERGNLRDKALQMGAQYRPDWGPGCTHLVCAFANTPKYQQVKGKGKIVTKKWITDCYKRETRLPARRYRLAGDSDSSDDSDSEEDQDVRGPPKRQLSATDKGNTSKLSETDDSSLKSAPAPTAAPSPVKSSELPVTGPKSGSTEVDDKEDDYEGSTDVESNEDQENVKKDSPSPGHESASDPDTEDELKRAMEEEDQYGGTTEDEDEDERIKQGERKMKAAGDEDKEGKAAGQSDEEGLPFLPDFFSNKHFLLYGELDSKTRRSVIRYVTAYNGTIDEYMNENVDFVITRQDWDNNFDDALAENVSLAFLRPEWIFACHEKGALVPFQRYIIAPS